MKKCDYFRDLILTDYIDGELDKKSAGSVESHLLGCGDCRAFLKEVKNKTAIFPVSCTADVLRQPVPAGLWDTVKQSIERQDHVNNPLADFMEKLKGMISLPGMVPVFASLALMFLAGTATLNTIQIQQDKDKEQGEYLVSLLGPAGPSSLSDNTEAETPIEHYFL